jgi:ATPase subunit of ABC transporter with duplicated ATPase domains
MAASLIARGISVTRGAQLVLDSVDITATPGQRIGLIGPNGVGKSTLLRVLTAAGGVGAGSRGGGGDGTGADGAGLDAGSVELAPPSAVVGLLPQEPERSADESVRAFLARRTGVAAAQVELDAATSALASGVEGSDDRYSLAFDRWMSLGSADFEARTGAVWADLGLDPVLLDRSTAVLSGGEAARCSLASLLLSRFDVFLLDEPTNDLDLDGLARLEAWVLGLREGMVIVSHDRTFLERVITDVVEIDFHTHRAQRFAGGWTAYVAERELARQHAQERFDDFDSKRRNLLGRAQREREWATQGRAKVRKSDEPDKNIRSYKINQTEQLAGKAARTDRALERLERDVGSTVEEPRTPWELRLDIPMAGRSGDVVAFARDAVVDRATFRLGPITVQLALGERVALLGRNGSGKSTLIDLLLGRTDAESGSAGLGSNVVIGEIEQARHQLSAHPGDDHTLLAVFMTATGMTVPEARTLLAKFGLVADHVTRPAASLSPGERTRASLALLMANGANLLVLDEPTNHLDLPAIEQLERALDTFAGTVVLVTHDRSLLERTRITRTIEMADGLIASDEGVADSAAAR